MNKERRKELEKARALIVEAQEIVLNCAEEEQDYYENMPDNLQDGEKYERAVEVADQLSEAADSCGEIADTLEDAKN